MHPAEHLRNESGLLSGKKIVLCVTGSIAAVETIKLARMLLRHGASVVPVMSPSSARIIHSDSLWFACGVKPVVELTGAVEHVSLCGEVPDHADLLLIAPCTANTLGKIAHGIDDTPVTTMATTALGTEIPVLIAPAMHASMYNNPMVADNIMRLENAGVLFVPPVMDEGKAKMASLEAVVAHVLRTLGPNNMSGKKVLVVSGPTVESLDDMRILTNRSTGRTGVELAKEAYRIGADVTILQSVSSAQPPPWLKSERFTSSSSLFKKVESVGDFDVILVPAAISDYAPEEIEGKIPSGKKDLSVNMKIMPKLLPVLRKKTPFLAAFKAESHVNETELEERARKLLETADMVVANDLRDVEEERTRVLIVQRNGRRIVEGSREEVAHVIVEEAANVV